MSLFRRRMMPTKKYAELEYIESDGNQYIDTGCVANQETRVVLDCEVIDRDGASGIIGQPVYDTAAMFSVRIPSGKNRFVSDYGRQSNREINIAIEGRLLIDKSSNITTIGDKSTTHTTYIFTGYNILIFSMAASSGGLYGAIGKIYSCRIEDSSGRLVRNMIPVIRKGVACMYDKISETYFYNQGTGEFIAGPIKK